MSPVQIAIAVAVAAVSGAAAASIAITVWAPATCPVARPDAAWQQFVNPPTKPHTSGGDPLVFK
jgi:hypothetical protein